MSFLAPLAGAFAEGVGAIGAGAGEAIAAGTEEVAASEGLASKTQNFMHGLNGFSADKHNKETQEAATPTMSDITAGVTGAIK